MNRLILALALTPALITTGALAQTVGEDVSKQMWCGSAFVAAFSNPPPVVPDDQLALAKVYIDQGNQMIGDSGQKYLNAGFTEEQLTKVKADTVTEVTAAVSGNGGDAKYTFDECKALMPNPPPDAPTADPSAPAPDASSAPAPDASSSAAQ
jgi:hypothetical protein